MIRIGILLVIPLVLAGCGTEDDDSIGQPFTPVEISLKESGELKELLNEKLIFVDSSGNEWTAPRGTLTDGASIPRLALAVTDGRWDKTFLKAAVVHDAYCQTENEARTPEQYRTRSWQDVHRMFYEACLAGGTGPKLAKVMFAAVWLAGPRWDDPSSSVDQVSSEVLTRGFVGAKNWIEGTDPSVEDIVADLELREPLLVRLNTLEVGVQTALQRGDTQSANRLLRREATLLNQELTARPDDLMLRSFEGYLHQNQAVVSRSLNNEVEVTQNLLRSEQAFNAVIADEPKAPGALTGLGQVSILRGQLDRGEEFTREALRVAPEHEAARRDLLVIEELRERED